MKNNKLFGMIRGLFGKVLAIGFLAAILAAASYAQSVRLVESGNSNNYLGTIYMTEDNMEYRIDFDGGGYIRIYMPCSDISKGSVEGNQCAFEQYSAGSILTMSGEAQVFTDATVNLKWKYWYNGNTTEPYYQYGWKEYVPDSK